MSVEVIQDELKYRLNAKTKTAEIISLVDNYAKSIYVPEQIDGYTVVDVLANVFAVNTQLEEILLPDSIKNLYYHAFFCCTNLRKVSFYISANPSKQLQLGEGVFAGCINLETIFFLQNKDIVLAVTEISAFDKCEKLTQIANGVFGRLGAYTFRNCKSLDALTFRDVYWKKSSFQGCASLSNILVFGRILADMPKISVEQLKKLNIYCAEESPLLNLAYEGFKMSVL